MKVSVIGLGNMGSAFAHALATVGVDVTIGGRDLTKAAALAADIGPHVQGGDIAAAAKVSDILLLALPFGGVADALKAAGDLSGKILIDISNPITADYKDLVVGHTTSAAEEIQALAPKAKVVKAFNTVFAQLIAPEKRKGQAVQVFVAGDDEGAKDTVKKLAEKLGFEAVEAGPLKNARFLEPVGEMNIHFGYFLGQGPVVAPRWVKV